MDISLSESIVEQSNVKKYIFVSVDINGNEIPMTNEEVLKFLDTQPKIKQLLKDQLPEANKYNSLK